MTEHKIKHYWINEQGIPVDIDLMAASYLRNALRLVITNSRKKVKGPTVVTVKFRDTIFFAHYGKTRIYIILCLIRNAFKRAPGLINK